MFFRPTLGDGGADRVTLTILEQLDRARYEPTLVLMRREGALIDRIPADVEVIDLVQRRLAFSIPALARIVRGRRPDVLMSTAGGANLIAVAAHRLARSKSRLVLSERNAVRRPGLERRNTVDVPLKRLMYPLADVVTAVSDGVGQDLIDVLRLPQALVRVVYNPIVGPNIRELGAVPLDHAWFAPGQPPVAVAVGRLVAQKDYPTMLRAFALLRERLELRLVVLGIGGARDELIALAAQLGLASVVEFVGFDPNPYRWMARGRVLLQSSVAEGLPGTLIQSMACGTPVVATDCDHGPREVVRDGVDGFLVPVGDHRALAERAARIITDPTLRAELSARSIEQAGRYTIAASMRRYEQALDGAS